jgi:cell division protein FtsW
MGLLPTKGLTLPLMSYGSNSLVTVCIMLALVSRVVKETRAAAHAPNK